MSNSLKLTANCKRLRLLSVSFCCSRSASFHSACEMPQRAATMPLQSSSLAGDLLLQNVASRLKDYFREGDTLARLGGDEFTMIIETSDVDVCAIVAKRILSELSRELILDSHHIQISGSIGASLYPNNSSDIDQLLHYAGIAMYQAKATGGNTCCKYPDLSPV